MESLNMPPAPGNQNNNVPAPVLETNTVSIEKQESPTSIVSSEPTLEEKATSVEQENIRKEGVKAKIKNLRNDIFKMFGGSQEKDEDNTEEERDKNKEKEIDLKEYMKEIERIRVDAAEKYLPENDPLRIQMIYYFSERPETQVEVETVLSKMESEEEIQGYIEDLKRFTEDRDTYISEMEHFFEINSVYSNRRRLEDKPRIASDTEYEMGVYTDYLESQVRDAVPALWEKGYVTFQSGYGEKDITRQYIDFYNKDISIPDDLRNYLQEKGLAVTLLNEDDRTTLSLVPQSGKPLRLSEWKEVWDTVAEKLPQTNRENVRNIEPTTEALAFRLNQDSLQKSN